MWLTSATTFWPCTQRPGRLSVLFPCRWPRCSKCILVEGHDVACVCCIWQSRYVVHIPLAERRITRNPAPCMPHCIRHEPGALQTAFRGDGVCTFYFRTRPLLARRFPVGPCLHACRSQGLTHAFTLARVNRHHGCRYQASFLH